MTYNFLRGHREQTSIKLTDEEIDQVGIFFIFNPIQTFWSLKKEKNRRKGKGRRFCLGLEEFYQFLIRLAVLPRTILKYWMNINCTMWCINIVQWMCIVHVYCRWCGTCCGRQTWTTISSSPAWSSGTLSPSHRTLPTASESGSN